MTKDDEINIVHGGGTHVVLLGAGASFASTLRNAEKSNKTLPLMWNIVDIVGLNDIVNFVNKIFLKTKNERLKKKFTTTLIA